MTSPYLLLARILMGVSLAFHIFFALFGVGLPLMLAVAYFLGIKTKNKNYIIMMERWSKGFAVLFAVGAVSGTIISKILALLWPVFMKTAAQVAMLPVFLEGYAFFIEAIFLGLFLYGQSRIKNQWLHFACLIPIVIGGAASAFFITTLDAWMNNPTGFDLIDGKLANVQPWVAMFNPATFTEVTHSIASYYATTAFIMAMLYAITMLRGNKTTYIRQALQLCMGVAVIFSFLTAVTGDASGKYLAEHEPAKLAAAEGHFETSRYASLKIGGIIENGELKYAIEIPWLLSLLAHNDPSKEVIGLNDFPPEDRPPLMIHYYFDIMVAIGTFLAGISTFYLFLVWKKKQAWLESKAFLISIIIAGVSSVIAVEAGWMLTCVGRQPWIIRGIMRTKDAVTLSHDVPFAALLFGGLYAVLTVLTGIILVLLYKRNPLKFDGDSVISKETLEK